MSLLKRILVLINMILMDKVKIIQMFHVNYKIYMNEENFIRLYLCILTIYYMFSLKS